MLWGGKLKKVEYLVAGTAVVMVIVSAIYSYQQAPFTIPGFRPPSASIYDKFFVQALKNISADVPKNETLIVSTATAVTTYFTGHPVKVPFKANSEKSLFDLMAKYNYTYLMVVRGRSSNEALKPLFSGHGVKSLDNDFQKIASYDTQTSHLYLYKRKT